MVGQSEGCNHECNLATWWDPKSLIGYGSLLNILTRDRWRDRVQARPDYEVYDVPKGVTRTDRMCRLCTEVQFALRISMIPANSKTR